ncbi:TPA: hypothetical protein EYO12_04485 [Candidatus Saccharibacteria bacterium]|nr:hypothetical protein [Candidatus Saccharibacteria bacterium]HIO87707.1 hypothetical protein [Candidatus Saccharibacteria bacterium]
MNNKLLVKLFTVIVIVVVASVYVNFDTNPEGARIDGFMISQDVAENDLRITELEKEIYDATNQTSIEFNIEDRYKRNLVISKYALEYSLNVTEQEVNRTFTTDVPQTEPIPGIQEQPEFFTPADILTTEDLKLLHIKQLQLQKVVDHINKSNQLQPLIDENLQRAKAALDELSSGTPVLTVFKEYAPHEIVLNDDSEETIEPTPIDLLPNIDQKLINQYAPGDLVNIIIREETVPTIYIRDSRDEDNVYVLKFLSPSAYSWIQSQVEKADIVMGVSP